MLTVLYFNRRNYNKDNNKVTDFIIEPQNGETPLKLYNRVKACTLFTPEFALDILKQTNNPRVMDVLFEKMEKALNDGADYPLYRAALLGMVAGRECRDTIKDKIAVIASSNGDKQAFDEACGQAQIIGQVAKLNVYDARKLGKRAELNNMEFDKYDDILFVPDVEAIDLQKSTRIPAKVADFARYPNLRAVMFGWTSFQKGYNLTLPKNVEIVDMRGHTDCFSDLSRYENLNTLYAGISRDFNPPLPESLQSLSLTFSKLSPELTAKVKNMPNLKSLDVSYCSKEKADEKELFFELPKSLSTFICNKSEVLDKRMFQLDMYPNLKKLEWNSFNFVEMQKKGVEMRMPPNLEEFTANFSHLTPHMLQQISEFDTLKKLELQWAHLGGYKLRLPPNLEELDLSSVQEMNCKTLNLSHLSHLKKLKMDMSGWDNPKTVIVPSNCEVEAKNIRVIQFKSVRLAFRGLFGKSRR